MAKRFRSKEIPRHERNKMLNSQMGQIAKLAAQDYLDATGLHVRPRRKGESIESEAVSVIFDDFGIIVGAISHSNVFGLALLEASRERDGHV